jgi:hypothetical protein
MKKTKPELREENKRLLTEVARLKTDIWVLEADKGVLEQRLGLRPKSKLIPESAHDQQPLSSVLVGTVADRLRRVRER